MTLSIDSAFPIGRSFGIILKFHKPQVQSAIKRRELTPASTAQWSRAVLSNMVATSYTSE